MGDRSTPALKEGDELPGLRFPIAEGRHESLTLQDLERMFHENSHPLHRGKGHYILHDSISIFVRLLREKMSRHSGKGPRVLVGDPLKYFTGTGTGLAAAFDVHRVHNDKTKETAGAMTLRLLLDEGHDPSTRPADYVKEIYDRFDKVLLPHFVGGNHFIVFEVALRSERGRYVKVWDGMEPLPGLPAPQWKSEIKAIKDVFFPGVQADVFLRQHDDPSQGRGHGCGPFAALTMAYLCHGMTPPRWTEHDEAVARHYLWACLLKRRVLLLPRQRL